MVEIRETRNFKLYACDKQDGELFDFDVECEPVLEARASVRLGVSGAVSKAFRLSYADLNWREFGKSPKAKCMCILQPTTSFTPCQACFRSPSPHRTPYIPEAGSRRSLWARRWSRA